MNRSSFPSRNARPGRAALQLAIVLAAIMLVVVPIGVGELSHEVARWYRAAAEEHRLAGQLNVAIERMDRAIEWSPDDVALYVQRAEFKRAGRQWASGLEDCDRAYELRSDLLLIEELRTEFLMRLGRHQEAVDSWKQIMREDVGAGVGQHADYLNRLAYSRAVGQLELPEGLEAVNEAFEITVSPVARLDPAGLLYFGRACTAMKRGDDQVALSGFNEAATRAGKIYQHSIERVEALAPIPREALLYQQRVRVLLPHLLGVLSQRAELLDRLDQADDAEKDRKRIDQLAPKGNSSTAGPLGLAEAIRLVSMTAGVLDTRGYLHYLLDDLPAAQQDMQQAVTAMEWVGRAFEWRMETDKHYVIDVRPLLLEKEDFEESIAVIRYHLMKVHESLGKDKLAAEDRQRIQELGYEPGDDLF